MSDTNGGPAQAPGAGGMPQLMVLAQYTKDLSFENPNAPQSLGQNAQPQINITVNVNAKQLGGSDFEVELRLEGKAQEAAGGSVMFNIELVFAGAFRIQNIPQENLQPVLMIECPRILFPFAREIIATAVRNGGFPPLLLDPIDFMALYQQRLSQAQPGMAGVGTA